MPAGRPTSRQGGQPRSRHSLRPTNAKKYDGVALRIQNPSFTTQFWGCTITITVMIGFFHHFTKNIGLKSMSNMSFYNDDHNDKIGPHNMTLQLNCLSVYGYPAAVAALIKLNTNQPTANIPSCDVHLQQFFRRSKLYELQPSSLAFVRQNGSFLIGRDSASALRGGGLGAAARSSLPAITSIILLFLIFAAVGRGGLILALR